MRTLAFYPTVALAIGATMGLPYIVVRPASLVPSALDESALIIAAIWALTTVIGVASIHRFRTVPFALALLVIMRLFAALYFTDWPGGDDQQANLTLAHAIASGSSYSVQWRGATMLAMYPPGYPLLLTGWAVLFGIGRASVLVLNNAVDLAAASALAAIIWPNGRRIALLCAFFYLAWPDRIISSLAPNKEGLALLFVCLITFSLLGRRFVLLGLSTGLLALTQPAWLPFPIIASLLVLKDDKRLILSGAVAAIVMLPWWIRNYLALHQFVPLTTSGPFSIMVAATGRFDEFNYYLSFGEIEGGKRAAADALHVIFASPARFAVSRTIEIVRSFCFDLEGIGNLGGGTAQSAIACQIYYAVMVGLAAAAIGKAGGVLPYILLAIFIQVVIFAPWVEFDMRHKELIVVPILLISMRAFTGLNKLPRSPYEPLPRAL